MRCYFCDKEIPKGARLFEFRSGVRRSWPGVDGTGGNMTEILGTESFGLWCEPCEGDRRILGLRRGTE
ncbi:MAG: hypothetical protein ACE5DW_06810 [Thermodesulfobacteriota bacterium]